MPKAIDESSQGEVAAMFKEVREQATGFDSAADKIDDFFELIEEIE